jgi:hypothetical protein
VTSNFQFDDDLGGVVLTPPAGTAPAQAKNKSLLKFKEVAGVGINPSEHLDPKGTK